LYTRRGCGCQQEIGSNENEPSNNKVGFSSLTIYRKTIREESINDFETPRDCHYNGCDDDDDGMNA
jgi:hypothetical protein